METKKKSMIDYDRLKEMLAERKEAINQISAQEILSQEGIYVSKHVIKCINPDHNDRHASMYVYNHDCHCYSCGATYNNLQIVQILEDVDFKEAGDIIAENNNLLTLAEMKDICRVDSHDYEKQNELKKRGRRKKFPLTKEMIDYMSMKQFGAVIIGKDITMSKPDNKAYFSSGDDDYPYVEGEEISCSLQDLFYSDEEAFWFMISGKVKEAYSKYAYMYENKFWKWEIAPGPQCAVALEKACWTVLETLAPLYRKCFPRCKLVKRVPVWGKEE